VYTTCSALCNGHCNFDSAPTRRPGPACSDRIYSTCCWELDRSISDSAARCCANTMVCLSAGLFLATLGNPTSQFGHLPLQSFKCQGKQLFPTYTSMARSLHSSGLRARRVSCHQQPDLHTLLSTSPTSIRGERIITIMLQDTSPN
jgi:hypothetical protein